MEEWLEAGLFEGDLSEDVEGYLLGRGGKPSTLERIGIREWRRRPEPAPSEAFRRKYGKYGEAVDGWVAIPVRSIAGRLLGVEFRAWKEKKVSEFRLPASAWNPFLIDLPRAAETLWRGRGDVWVVGGVYDLFPLDWVIPEGDAVVSTLRAGFARSTVEFFRRYCRTRVHLVYDNDATGRKATVGWTDPETGKRRPGAIELLTAAGVRAEDFRYRGKDPGDVWAAGGLPALRKQFVRYPEARGAA